MIQTQKKPLISERPTEEDLSDLTLDQIISKGEEVTRDGKNFASCLILRSSARSANTGTQSGNVKSIGAQLVTGSLRRARQSLTLTMVIVPTQTTSRRMCRKKQNVRPC